MLKTSLTTLLLLAAGVITPALAEDRPINFHATGARVDASFVSGPLTLPSPTAAAQVVTGFLAARYTDRTLDSLTIERQWQGNGLTHVRLGQQVGGLDVYGTYAQGAINRHGELVHLMENLAAAPPAGGLRPARIDATAALGAALAATHPGVAAPAVAATLGNTTRFARDPLFWTAPTAKRVAIPMASGAFEEGFLVETWADATNLLHHTLVGADGRVLGVQLRTNTDSYNIFPDHPGNSLQTITDGPGAGNTESPNGGRAGSQRSIEIAGNNARAYLDADTNNAPDPGGMTIIDGNFLSTADLTQDPSTADNQEVAVQNLFYLNNVIHDKLYRHGFIEAVGNFQEDNFGNGGQGSDSVNAEAQDGGGLNNANFATPTDGANPRMQMYLWDKSTPRRDGDLDSDIPWHEYGHGLTWRMIGNMSGPLSGAVGEGNSDVLAILTNDDDVVGEYSYNDPLGIRSEPYDAYSRTYGDFTGSSVHFDGEIYAATLWDLKKRYTANSIPLDTLWDDMVGGMSFTPAGPAFEDMRDGILQQASGSGRECLVWESFAAFGIGVGATASVKGGGPFGGGSVTISESFALPSQCGGGPGSCAAIGDSCSNDADCCSGNCSGGKPSTRVCQ